MNGRRFLFHTGLGFDAAVIRRVERYGELKRYASHPLHVVAAFETWFRHFDRSKPRFDITLETGERIEGVYFAIVSKTSPYTYLGPRPLIVAPEAGLHTPLALTAFRSLNVADAARRRRVGDGLGQVPPHGAATSCSATTSASCASKAADAFPYQADGDDLGDVEDLDIDYEDDTLTSSCPRRRLPACYEYASAASATSGTFVMIASTPARGQRPDLVGIVDGPHVDAQTRRRARSRDRASGRGQHRRRDRDAATRGRASRASCGRAREV